MFLFMESQTSAFPKLAEKFLSLIYHFTNSRPLQTGDIINIDITVFLKGYHGDTSKTFLVGDVVIAEKRFRRTITF